MTWVSEALVEASEPILEKVSALVAEALPRGSAVSAEEVAQQARVTLGLLIEIVEGDPTDGDIVDLLSDKGKFIADRRRNGDNVSNGLWAEADIGVLRVVTCD